MAPRAQASNCSQDERLDKCHSARGGDGPCCPTYRAGQSGKPALVCWDFNYILSRSAFSSSTGREVGRWALTSGAGGGPEGLALRGAVHSSELLCSEPRGPSRGAVLSRNKARRLQFSAFSLLRVEGKEGSPKPPVFLEYKKKKKKKPSIWARHGLSVYLRLCFLRTRHRLELLPRRLQTRFAPARHAFAVRAALLGAAVTPGRAGTAPRGGPALLTPWPPCPAAGCGSSALETVRAGPALACVKLKALLQPGARGGVWAVAAGFPGDGPQRSGLLGIRPRRGSLVSGRWCCTRLGPRMDTGWPQGAEVRPVSRGQELWVGVFPEQGARGDK